MAKRTKKTKAAEPVRVEDLPDPEVEERGEDGHGEDEAPKFVDTIAGPIMVSEPTPEPEPEPEAQPASEPPPRVDGRPRSSTPNAANAAQRRSVHAGEAYRCLVACTKRLAMFDWQKCGIDGVSGALAILRSALPKAEIIAKKRTGKFTKGDAATLSARGKKKWGAILEGAIRVVEYRRPLVVIEDAKGRTAIVQSVDLSLEVAS